MTDDERDAREWLSGAVNQGCLPGTALAEYGPEDDSKHRRTILALLDAAEAAQKARDAALEEAAKMCDDAASTAPSTEYGGGFTDGVTWAAANIRALKWRIA